MPKLENPQGAVETVANANELKEQLDAANVEREALSNDKATLESQVSGLTDENTQLKNELQEVKDQLTAAELKASGNESLANESAAAVDTAKSELEAAKTEKAEREEFLNAEIAKNLQKIQDLEAKVAELTVDVIVAVEEAEAAADVADAVTEQNELIDKHLQVRGAKPETTDTAKDKASDEAITKFKDLQKAKRNARNRADEVEFSRQLRNLQRDPRYAGAIADYLNSEYSPVKPEKETVYVSDEDMVVYNAYKALTEKRAKSMKEPGTLENRRKNQAAYQRDINNMLKDPEKSAAIRRAQQANQ